MKKNNENICLKFIADGMLFDLAKWLILLGYNVERRKKWHTVSNLNSVNAGAVFLTAKDRKGDEIINNAFIIKSADLSSQIKEIAAKYPIDFSRYFLSRCSHCNVQLVNINIEDVRALLPEKVREWATECKRCPQCGKLFWMGTHTDRMKEKIRNEFGIEI